MKSSLAPYASKRSFDRTSEPAPKLAARRSGPLLFVIQQHAARRLHYDFRLELDGVLKSWAVPKGPSLDPLAKRLAVAVEDHPFAYASFEGVIPAGEYGAGKVIVWDCGVYSPDADARCDFDDRRAAEERVHAGLAAGKLSLLLRGQKLKGSFALVRTSTGARWLLLKHRDRFAGGGVPAAGHSVLSGATLDTVGPDAGRLPAEELTAHGPAESAPRRLAPMLAETGDRLRTEARWAYEPKLDGYRVIAHVAQGAVRLISRRGLELSRFFPEIVSELAQQAVGHMILDGEIVAFGADARPSFNALQKRAQLKEPAQIERAQRESPAALVCFDLLHFAGLNLRASPYGDRRRYLAQCLLPSPHLQLVHVEDDAESLYRAALASGFEGVVAKRRDSPYLSGRRSPSWRKYKAMRSIEMVVGGYTRGKGARNALGALLLGYWRSRQLCFAGHVGSGLDAATLEMLRARLVPLTRERSPFAAVPPLHRPTIWVAPALVVEVSFAEWTPDGVLRAPTFVRVRDDVEPRSVKQGPTRDLPAASRPAARARGRTRRREPGDALGAILRQLEQPGERLDLELEGERLRLTNLDRVYWPADARGRRPAVTKRDLICYLAAVSRFMLPHLKDRPLTMIRMPEGIDGERFFQKHWEHTLPPFVDTVAIFSGHRGERQDYLLANNLPTLLWLAQNGTLEFHIWHSRVAVEDDAVSRSRDFSSSLAALEASVLNYPDYLVFDIDPYIYSGHEARGAEPELNQRGFEGGKRVAFWLRELLTQMSLEAYVKTSGKTGLHVFVPIERSVTFDAAREICESIGRHLLSQHPAEITMEWAVQKRSGKIFIDYNMNVRGKTLNVAYSPRGIAGAPVSMPLSWEELETAEPLDFTIDNVIPRLERQGDRWHDLSHAKQSLAQAFGRTQRT